MSAPRQCTCGATIVMMATPSGSTMPVDVDPDPAGILMVVDLPGVGAGVVVMSAAQRADPPPHALRRSPHWATCPHADRHRTGRPAAPQVRSGPCARCGIIHPHRYGPGVSDPLCPTCRETHTDRRSINSP